jgi:hypothetical protein
MVVKDMVTVEVVVDMVAMGRRRNMRMVEERLMENMVEMYKRNMETMVEISMKEKRKCL